MPSLLHVINKFAVFNFSVLKSAMVILRQQPEYKIVNVVHRCYTTRKWKEILCLIKFSTSDVWLATYLKCQGSSLEQWVLDQH